MRRPVLSTARARRAPRFPRPRQRHSRAKSIALGHAGVSASSVSFSKAKLDDDDGRGVYEIEFYVGNAEYDYEIDAYSGGIIVYDIDRD